MTRVHRALATLAATLAFAAALVDARPAIDAATLASEIEADRDHISAPELAERIMRRDPALLVFDLRSREEYDAFHIASASHATLDELARASFPREASIVLYSEGSTHAAQAWVLGVDVTWPAVLGPVANHDDALPTYAFKGLRHWLDAESAATGGGLAPSRHPLLGASVPLAAEDGFLLYQDVLDSGPIEPILRGYTGYLVLLPRLLAAPLHWVAPEQVAAWCAVVAS